MDAVSISKEQENFCYKIVGGMTPVEAYRAVFDCSNITLKQSLSLGNGLIRRKYIRERITELRDQAARVAIVDGAKVIAEWSAIALGDVSSLVQYQRVNCRHCNGVDNKFQWLNEDEYAIASAKAIDLQQSLPECSGGFGFRKNGEPSEECPHCCGEGEGRVFLKDTRYLTADEKRLYAGVKMTNAGIEIKTRDQDAALLNLAKYFKLLSPEQKDTTQHQLEIVIKGGLPE
jgi:phage terminase small subunit